MRKIIISFLAVGISLSSFLLALLAPSPARADWNSGNFISEYLFADINDMNTVDIQSFLISKNSYLKDLAENGRSAAQIIYDAAHGGGEATLTMSGIAINSGTGTISPEVILTTLQKEQSLITRTSRDDDALRKAMGFGCPDSGSCNPAYAGFTKQVENGAWQLRFNYERAQGRGFADYQAGQTMNFDGTNVFLANRAVASLYRYTPHLSGNQSFYTIYSKYFGIPTYAFLLVDQGPWSGPGSSGNPLSPGQDVTLWARFQNVGILDWVNGGDYPMNLGAAWPQDRISPFINSNRATNLAEARVSPGGTGTFRFAAKAPRNPGVYVEHFEPVIEKQKWMNTGLSWQLTVGNPTTVAQVIEQAPKATDAKVHLSPNQSTNLFVRIQNSSGATWYSDNAGVTPYVMRLGTANPHDRKSAFLGNLSPRVYMNETAVPVGQSATFSIPITAPSQKGEYREFFDPVVEGFAWINTGLHWDIVVE